MELSARPIANPAAALREVEDGWAVLVNLDTGGSLALNPTGLIVWRLVDGARSAGEIAADVARRFADSPPSVTADVLALLDTLAEEGLIGFEWTPEA